MLACLGEVSSTMMSQTLAALSAWLSAVTLTVLLSSSPMLSSFLLRSSSRLATKLLSDTDPNLRWRLDFRDDLLLPSLDEELFLLLES